ncbi:autophagy protein 16 [Myriangium duriaei CBS 260.36]|uniref:Autophagy protein 16 n=1 Tax=Myriangium duriaei CBS 260.36 TaxID=1168546 RepID=A0A9P4JD77_9PEZI|nr:autophagy protein 16 [Myriangium duriaei CBS 260.36]
MAADWIAKYSSNLDIRDRREAVHKRYIDAYTHLADRLATAPSVPSTTTSTAPKNRPTSPQAIPDDSLRSALATANTARATLSVSLSTAQSQIAALETSLATSTSRITHLEHQIAQLTTHKRDRDHELREKSKLLEAVQDEVVGLTLERNLAEEKVGVLEGEGRRLRGENEELVRRWVERVGVEAEMAGISGGGREG